MIDPAVLPREYTGELGDLRGPQTSRVPAHHAEHRGDRSVRLPAEECGAPNALGREVQDPVLHHQLRAHLQRTRVGVAGIPVEGGAAQDIGAQLPAVQVSCRAVVVSLIHNVL